MRERGYAARTGISRGVVLKAWHTGRLALFADGSIDAALDARRAGTTNPDQQQRPVGKTTLSGPGENRSYLKVRTAFMIYQTQKHRIAVVSKAMSRTFLGGSVQ